MYSQFCESGEIKLFPGAVQLVKCFASSFRLAVASGSWAYDIRTILKYADAEQHFPVILGKESALREKPYPDVFLEAAKKLNTNPSE